ELGRGGAEVLVIDVAQGDDVLALELLDVVPALVGDADEGEVELLVGRLLLAAGGQAGVEADHGRPGGGSAQELPAGNRAGHDGAPVVSRTVAVGPANEASAWRSYHSTRSRAESHRPAAGPRGEDRLIRRIVPCRAARADRGTGSTAPARARTRPRRRRR